MNFANYLHIPYLRHAGELVIVCTAIVGAGLGFLWFNTYPAQVFMGDVGSLALGGALGIIAVLLRQEFLLVIMGGVFVVETLSVILQVGSFKLRGQRIFRMAPIHHHYELKGWPEPRVIVRFWIISLMLVLIGLGNAEGTLIMADYRGQKSRYHRVGPHRPLLRGLFPCAWRDAARDGYARLSAGSGQAAGAG